MTSNSQKLITYWEADGLPIQAGAKLKDIEGFEQKHNVRFPHDFRSYLLCVNGMNPYMPFGEDRNGYLFWTLDSIRSVPEEAERHAFSADWLSFSDARSYFIFADYFQWSWAIAIRLSANSTDTAPIFFIGKQAHPIWIAASFTEFVALYLADAPALYGNGNEES
jgi:SMI1-KNR4 cell-wall